MSTELLLSLAGVFGLGTIVSQVVLGGSARRTLRADVLRALAQCEKDRWVTSKAAQQIDFRATINDFRATAMIAQLPRALVERYVLLAEAAQRLSREDFDEKDGEPQLFAGSITGDLSTATSDAAESISDAAWHPLRTRARGSNSTTSSEEALARFLERPRHGQNEHFAEKLKLRERYPWASKELAARISKPSSEDV